MSGPSNLGPIVSWVKSSITKRQKINATAELLVYLEENSKPTADYLTGILDFGADVNGINRFGDTVLVLASYRDSSEIVSLLLTRGANPLILGREGNSPLIAAVTNNHLANAKILIKQCPDLVNIKNNFGLSPLAIAVTRMGETSANNMARLLVSSGANIQQCREQIESVRKQKIKKAESDVNMAEKCFQQELSIVDGLENLKPADKDDSKSITTDGVDLA